MNSWNLVAVFGKIEALLKVPPLKNRIKAALVRRMVTPRRGWGRFFGVNSHARLDASFGRVSRVLI